MSLWQPEERYRTVLEDMDEGYYEVDIAVVEGMNEPEIYIKDLPGGGSICIMSLKELKQFLKKKTKLNQNKRRPK